MTASKSPSSRGFFSRLLCDGIQVNIDAGSMPDRQGEQQSLMLALNLFRPHAEGKRELHKLREEQPDALPDRH
jgi:hypothetical protein